MRELTVKVRFSITDVVYLKTDPEQSERFVTGLMIRPNDILYEVTLGDKVSNHYEFELDEEKDVLKKLNA